MAGWYLDEGLQRFVREWKGVHPGAVVYSIGDSKHAQNPRSSQHAPDDGNSGGAGDDIGEVDAIDVMPGSGGVTERMLDDLFDELIESRDKRILYVIHRDVIVSSVTKPWVRRKYNGEYHSHVHISVNDNFDNDQSDWKWEKMAARTVEFKALGEQATLPELQFGDDDSELDGYNHVMRVQALANLLVTDKLDIDGVYGAKTTAALKKIFGGDGKKLPIGQIKQLHGIS